MTRTVLPLAALLSLVGLPAAAAELGDEGAATTQDSASSSVLSPSVDQAEADRAERRGSQARSGGNKGGKSTAARSNNGHGPARAPAAPAAAAARPIQAPAAAASAARSPAASPSRAPAAHAAPNTSRSSAAARPASQDRASAARTTPRGAEAHKPGTRHEQAGNGPQAHNARPPAHARPGGSPAARPGPKPGAAAKKRPHHVVQRHTGLPPRWSPKYHRYHLRGVPHHHPRYWATGVFIYNPPPPRHRVVVVDGSGKRVADEGPSRAVDRNNSFGVGIRGGSYMSGYMDGGGYGDLGLGLALRYRPVEAVGFEASWMHHSDTWDDHAERATDPVSASVQLFAFPWTRVSPYALVGLTVTPREVEDTYYNGLEYVEYEAKDALAGPHAGLGIEFAIGQSAAIGFEGRYVGYIDRQEGDNTIPGAFQGNMGLNFYF